MTSDMRTFATRFVCSVLVASGTILIASVNAAAQTAEIVQPVNLDPVPNYARNVPAAPTETDAAAIAALSEKLSKADQRVQQLEGWVGTLLARSQDEIDRRRWEAEARLIAPELGQDELPLLNRWEVNTDLFEEKPQKVEWDTVGAAHMQREVANDRPGMFYRYSPVGTLPKDPSTGRYTGDDVPTLKVDATLPPLRVAVTKSDTPWPTVTATYAGWRGLFWTPSNVYFEFDTDPSFTSRNLWRYPTLMPTTAVANLKPIQNLTTTKGLSYYIFRTTLRDYVPTNAVRFPFRVTAMGLPLERGNIDFSHLVKTAKLLGHGLTQDDLIREIYEYGRMTLTWGGNTIEHQPIDTFRAGVAACGAVNDLVGAMLEMNGIRSRLVGGFDPRIRVWYPGGGHTALEVWNGQRWSFLDSFLDLYLPNVSAKDFALSSIGKTTIGKFQFTSEQQPYREAFSKAIGTAYTFQQLFRYRIYGDKAVRLPLAHMLRLRAGSIKSSGLSEASYGLTWPLRTTDITFDPNFDLPETTRIYVRARYVRSSCAVQQNGSLAAKCSDPDATASAWTVSSFQIRPQDLLRTSK